MQTAKDYIEDLFSNEVCDDSVITGSKKIMEDKLCAMTESYLDEGCTLHEAEENAKKDLHKYQNHLLCSTIKTFSDKYTQMVALYKRAKISVISIISVLFLCCLFLTTGDMSNKSVWIFIWVVVVIICAGILLTMDYLRREYRKSIFKLLSDTNLSREHLELLGIDFDDGDEEIFDDEDDEESEAEDNDFASEEISSDNQNDENAEPESAEQISDEASADKTEE